MYICCQILSIISSIILMLSSYVPSLRLDPIHLPSEQLIMDSLLWLVSLHAQVTFSLAFHCRPIVPLLKVGFSTNVITGGFTSNTSKERPKGFVYNWFIHWPTSFHTLYNASIKVKVIAASFHKHIIW